MSRLAKKPINIPAEVKVTVAGNTLIFNGPKGELKKTFSENIEFKLEGASLVVTLKKEEKKKDPSLGSAASLVKNAIAGVSLGFQKKLEIEGVGYKVQMEGANLILSLGFTHKVIIVPPKDISFKVEKNAIFVTGIDKETVGMVSADIRSKKLPEPYKGKGIHYFGEVIRRKAGKKAVSAA
ncbi:MAG: 50S ribosomal protein L6 [bacterium]|nr:50S ribosomal protein L6 [bacterium]